MAVVMAVLGVIFIVVVIVLLKDSPEILEKTSMFPAGLLREPLGDMDMGNPKKIKKRHISVSLLS